MKPEWTSTFYIFETEVVETLLAFNKKGDCDMKMRSLEDTQNIQNKLAAISFFSSVLFDGHVWRSRPLRYTNVIACSSSTKPSISPW